MSGIDSGAQTSRAPMAECLLPVTYRSVSGATRIPAQRPR